MGLLLAAAPAAADRSYDSQITGAGNPGFTGPIDSFVAPVPIALDANDNAWIASQYNLYKYNAYPSQTLLAVPNITPAWGHGGLGTSLSLAVDQATGEVFAADSNRCAVYIFDHNGLFERAWDNITSICSYFADPTVATDNTHTYSRGRVYLAFHSTGDVEVFDAAHRPVEFPATADYITDNKLTGTPSGPFGSVTNVAVDSNGNVFVVDSGNGVVDEFDSTGAFLRAFTGAGAPGGFNPQAVAADPTNGNVLIDAGGAVDEFDSSANFLSRLPDDPNGPLQPAGSLAVNSSGYVYLSTNIPGSGGVTPVDIFTPNAVVPTLAYKPVTDPTTTSGTLNAGVDPNGGGDVTTCHFEYGTDASYGTSIPCSPDPSGSHFSSPTDVSAAISGLTTETAYHYRVVVANANGTSYGADQTYTPHGVIGLRTDPVTNLTAGGATLNGSLLGDGTTTSYYFEWGPTTAYGHTTATPPGADIGSPSGPSATPLSFDLSGLDPYTTYHYRIVATNGAGTSYGDDRAFTTTPGAPSVGAESVGNVHSDRVVFHAQVNPNGADTSFHFEYVADADFQQSGFANATKSAPEGVGMGKRFQDASQLVDGLTPGTLYHYRTVATNQTGTGTPGADRTFTTFSFTPQINDACPNAHVRQQTGAALLLDCRAYELASAANAGGYDVESDLVAGQAPFGGYPQAQNPSQLLYGVHDGAIPGTGNPTNHGVDPYVATRGADGWSTTYVGIPANGTPSSASFGSPLADADSSLDTFAFAGPDLCSPCFPDGKAGTPIHLPDGSLVQGMAGSIDPGPSAAPAGIVKKHLSADGSHFVFGSEQQFEPAGNPDNGNVTIYDRDLKAGTTQVVSTNPGGTALADGSGVAELDISSNGSRILTGDLIHTDSQGNRYYHLYMHVGNNPDSIDLTPGTTTGALYDGMSSDGTKVYFTTADPLTTATNQDTDTSADIYEMDLSDPQNPHLTRVSIGSGATGDTDTCDPAANTIRTHWNSVGSAPNCDVVAVGGGGGVASGDGTIYFLSPELLDGGSNGVPDAPNLYIARPGSAPHFIRTLESTANAPLPAPVHPFLRSYGSFLNPAGVAIDHASGDVYVLDIGTFSDSGTVQKFDSSGQLVTSFGTNGVLSVSGVSGFNNLPCQIAVDNDPSSPSYGDLYVPDLLDGVVNKIGPSGQPVGHINVDLPTGVAVDPTNGHVYVTSYPAGVSVYGATGAPTSPTSFSTIPRPTGIAVDSSGNAYVVNGGGVNPNNGTTEVYDSSGNDVKTLDSNPSNGVAVDPSNDHVYVDEGNRVVEYDSSGNPTGVPSGSGLLSHSISLAVDSGNLDVSNPGAGKVAAFGPAAIPSDPSTDNPLVIDSVSSAGTRNTADFQVNPSGDDAVFTSALPLTGYDNATHREVFRYDAPTDHLDCVSCNPTGEQATGEASLASNGSSLTDDGRVFFNSTEGLVDRDLNNKKDAYEWSNGKIELISTGISPLDSSLLGVSADGTDAFFFTHDSLVPSDQNGGRVKVYDARANGGFAQSPAPVPCQASDECHGAGSTPPPPPNIKTIAGTPVGNATPGKVKKHHPRKHHRRRHHNSRHHKRAGANHGGNK